LGFQRNEPMTFCFRAQAATVALISHFKTLTYEKLYEVYIGFLTKKININFSLQNLFLWSDPEQKLNIFTPYMAAFFIKTCPYKITDRKIINVEHNIIDSSRCLIIIV
jgi:hypothetical protein